MYNLFYDETYNVNDIYKSTKKNIYFNEDWVEIDNYEDFVIHILKNGLPKLISFGHDVVDNTDDKVYFQQIYKGGYECVLWLFEYCRNNELSFPEYIIHSNNKNSSIKELLESLTV